MAGLLLLAMLSASTLPVDAQVRGEVSAAVENGFARLVFTLSDDVESDVKASNGVLVISFQRPVQINVEKLAQSAAGYLSVARRDPDGRGIRIALARKVRVNSLPLAERLFVDLLPEEWSGPPPGLPRDVIEELSRRAREADKKVRQQQVLARQSKLKSIRVRVAVQPTFTRYVFDLPEPTTVATHSDKDKLSLTFGALLKFDLADVKATLPEAISRVDSEADQDTSTVRFAFAGKVDVRTFREGISFIVDVSPMDGQRSEASPRNDGAAAAAAELQALVKAPPAIGEASARSAPSAGDAVRGAPPRSPGPEARPAEETAQVRPVAERPVPDTKPAAETDRAPSRPSVTPASEGRLPSPAPTVSPTPGGEPAARRAEPAVSPKGGAEPNDKRVDITTKATGEQLVLRFPFAQPTPAAVFTRGDTLWLVFDTDEEVSLAGADGESGNAVRNVSVMRDSARVVVRLRLERPRQVRVDTEDAIWSITLGSEPVDSVRPLSVRRHHVGSERASISVALEDPRHLHRITDPDVGDALLVVTALGPARGVARSVDLVDLRALGSLHGVALAPIADDIVAELAPDRVVVSRPKGLTLSAASGPAARSGRIYQQQLFNTQTWGFDRHADYEPRRAELVRAAAEAPESKRNYARVDLARFFLAREMGAEAKGVLDVALADRSTSAEDGSAFVLRGVAQLMIGRPEAALRDLNQPFVGNQHDAPLWRAVALARQGKWNEAHAGFRASGSALGALPLELQRTTLNDMVRAAIEAGDITGAASQMQEFEAIGVTRELEATLSVLSGRVAEGLERYDDALRAYQTAADSWNRPVAAQGRLRELALQLRLNKLPRSDAIAALETLTTVWRGDETEVEALQLLSRLYTEESRHRDAFQVMRTALAAHPGSEMTRRIQDEAAENFENLFLSEKGDALQPVEALALFYDFRDLTPIGRRGDEMIRRLADRLVAVDLLAQAAELLQHQVDHRLQGAARAQVAIRLAGIYLMNHKPDRALATLRASRAGEVSSELRTQRLLLEARALSDLGRHGVASEIAAAIPGPEAMRLNADVLWAGQRWRESAEQIELLHGDRWREFDPLTETERRDIVRAAVGYALGEDKLGLMRLREKYAAKMGDGPDRRAFDVVTTPVEADGKEFTEIVRRASTADTLAAFLSDMRNRFSERRAGGAKASAPTAR